jgi:hypothetical protein
MLLMTIDEILAELRFAVADSERLAMFRRGLDSARRPDRTVTSQARRALASGLVRAGMWLDRSVGESAVGPWMDGARQGR